MYRFLASTRWLGWFLMVCVFAAACAGLGNWQMTRLDEARADNGLVEANYDAVPVPFSDTAGSFETLDEADTWLPVALRGEYLTADTTIVRNRPLSGAPGYEVLVPFRTESGAIVAINRGWLPIGNETAGRPDAVPAPPRGTVDVVARLKAGEPDVQRTAPEGQLASIELTELERVLGYDIAKGAFGVLAAEEPAPADAPTALPRPEVDEGNHLSYSLQWFAFAVLGFIGLGYAAKQQARINREDREAEAEAAAAGLEVLHSAYRAPRRRQTRRRDGQPTDEELEDAYVDALESGRER